MKLKTISPYFYFGTAIFILLVWIYYPIFLWMYGRFISPDSYYSHGFLIPIGSAFLIWQNRKKLKGMQFGYSNTGLILIVAALLLHLLSTIFYIFSASGFTILLLLCGISLFIFGKEITKVILFPLLFLLFMFPLPEAFISPLANPMKMYVAKFAASFVDLLGIPVFREGYYINTINGEVLVGNPCSGLRSLISFLAIGTYFAYFLRASKIRKLLLPCLSIPIALGCNALRVVSLVLVTHYYGSAKASPDSFFHDFSGFMVFFIGSIILLGIWGVLEWKD